MLEDQVISLKQAIFCLMEVIYGLQFIYLYNGIYYRNNKPTYH